MRARVALVAVVLLALVCLGIASAQAAAPRQQGWWTASPVLGPDVPDDGLVVEGAAASPASIAALVYDVASDATVGKLKLVVAPSSATIPNVTLQLCPLAEQAIQPAQGGAMADAPEFDCATNVTAQPGSDGSTYEFDVASLLGDGVLAVAVVGTTPADRVVLSAPDGNSLPIEQVLSAGSTSLDGGLTSPSASTSDLSSPLQPAPSVPAGDGSTASRGPADRTNVGAGVAVSNTSSPDDETAQNGELLVVLLGLIVLLGGWLAIGRGAALRAEPHSSIAGSEGVGR